MSPVKHNCMATFEATLESRYLLCVPSDSSIDQGRRIKELRRRRGLTQQELADLIGKKRPMVSEWENGQGLTEANLRLVAGALEVAAEEIGAPWDPESPRPKRHLQQSHPPPFVQSPVAAPPQPPAGIAMGPGDRVLWDQFVGVWMLCRDDEERRALVEHTRSFVEQPAERRPKKAVR